MEQVCVYETEIGKIAIGETDGAVTHLWFSAADVPPDAEMGETALLREAAKQLREYLAGTRREFGLPLAPRGTDFQKAVWSALREIPYGETRSYGEIAARVGNPRACRAVGMANHRNPIAVFIPCHRVVGADGGLTGYAGGLACKERLLRLEKQDAGR